MGSCSHGHLELIGTMTGEVVPWEVCNCLPWSRIKVYVWRGKVESDREETRVKAGCAKRKTNRNWGAAVAWLPQTRYHQPPTGPGAHRRPGNRTIVALSLHTSLRELDYSLPIINFSFAGLEVQAEGRGFGGRLIAADSLLKERRNALRMLCRE